ncbi:HU family DNA-binding protein [Spiroplasma endosymbiont of Anurida maritima]|uniref:HU family DNA-binding protein n=1 Tax=Spiroplasma endosymbiont of Anurida maritima TaxID=2967972 RepID=UPI0036D35A45
MANETKQLTKKDLIVKVAEKCEITKSEAESVVQEFLQTIIDEVKEGNKIAINGFGTFERSYKDAAVYRNPKTGEPIHKDGKNIPKFKFSNAFKDSVL